MTTFLDQALEAVRRMPQTNRTIFQIDEVAEAVNIVTVRHDQQQVS